MQICSAIRSGKDTPSCRWCSALWRFSSRLHSSILLLAIRKTQSAFCPYEPIADSPDSIKASAYCRTASETSATLLHESNIKPSDGCQQVGEELLDLSFFAESDYSSTSARVGVGYSTIDSRSWEATITGLFSCLQTWVIFAWTTGICSSGISTPRSPRATMIPSEASMISSKCWSDSKLSIFARTPIDLWRKTTFLQFQIQSQMITWTVSQILIFLMC